MDEVDQAALHGAALDEDAATARGAAEAEVGTQAVDVPGPAPARVRAAELEAIADPERNGSGHARWGTSIGGEGSTPAGGPGWPDAATGAASRASAPASGRSRGR